MAGRALAFSDPEITALAVARFTCVAADDWYQRRREDAEGRFFRSVADQGPRTGEGGSTRQGVYCLTPRGKLLAYVPGDVPVARMLETLRGALVAWDALSPEERAAAPVSPRDREADPRFRRALPPGALVLDVTCRALTREPGAPSGIGGRDGAAQHDHMWITKEEWASFIPADPVPGATAPFPEPVARRLARYHLVDSTRGEPAFWEAEEVRARDISLRVERVTADSVRLSVTGTVRLATSETEGDEARSFDPRLIGWLEGTRDVPRAFELVAFGNHRGAGPYTPDPRSGAAPIGIFFELIRPARPADRVPPQAARDLEEYLER